ncbi:hypothetical protein; 45766-46074 [Arabidopsis thaliana]|uniref:Uncharacterized protein F7A10.2 n=1 Tax=Arabidopsis thaliana TaxID=3702 RepID=Q9C8A2_ARATH|nr:hypothetical protein; 45766-46074 [Arabidopsis thaliana]
MRALAPASGGFRSVASSASPRTPASSRATAYASSWANAPISFWAWAPASSWATAYASSRAGVKLRLLPLTGVKLRPLEPSEAGEREYDLLPSYRSSLGEIDL